MLGLCSHRIKYILLQYIWNWHILLGPNYLCLSLSLCSTLLDNNYAYSTGNYVRNNFRPNVHSTKRLSTKRLSTKHPFDETSINETLINEKSVDETSVNETSCHGDVEGLLCKNDFVSWISWVSQGLTVSQDDPMATYDSTHKLQEKYQNYLHPHTEPRQGDFFVFYISILGLNSHSTFAWSHPLCLTWKNLDVVKHSTS